MPSPDLGKIPESVLHPPHWFDLASRKIKGASTYAPRKVYKPSSVPSLNMSKCDAQSLNITVAFLQIMVRDSHLTNEGAEISALSHSLVLATPFFLATSFFRQLPDSGPVFRFLSGRLGLQN
jgi:hypothetical protein